jgi:hypothetical protein
MAARLAEDLMAVVRELVHDEFERSKQNDVSHD